MADRQQQIEEVIAHQQRLVDLLNEAITKQQEDLLSLERRVITLEQKYFELLQQAGEGELPHEKPPHY